MKHRYFFTSIIGDGGEMTASAYPEGICNGDEPESRGDHSFDTWVSASNTSWALINGIAYAETYFRDLDAQAAARRKDA